MPDIDSSNPPSDLDTWSLAPSSAAAQNTENPHTQTKLRKLAEQKAKEIQLRCNQLERKLMHQAAQKRKADAAHAKQLSGQPDLSSKKHRANPRPITDMHRITAAIRRDRILVG